MCFQNEKLPRPQASQPCSCPHIIRLLSQEEGVFAQDLEPAPIEDGIVYPEPGDSPTLDTRQGSHRLLGPCIPHSYVFSFPVCCTWVGGWLQAIGLPTTARLPHLQSCSWGRRKAGVHGAAAHHCSPPLPSPVGLSGSEFQVQAPSRGTLGRVYADGRGSEKHSPDSACSVDFSSSRLSSPEHPNEGEAASPGRARSTVGVEAPATDGCSVMLLSPSSTSRL